MLLELTPDLINGVFETLGGLFVANHCRALMKDKAVKGLSILSVICFFLWGVWNLWYYPHLGQMWSFYGGVATVSANVVYISLLLYYKRNQNV